MSYNNKKDIDGSGSGKKKPKDKEGNIKKLKILHWNANSIIGKHESVRELVLEQKPDIICLECNELGRTPPQESYIYELCSLGYILFIRSR